MCHYAILFMLKKIIKLQSWVKKTATQDWKPLETVADKYLSNDVYDHFVHWQDIYSSNNNKPTEAPTVHTCSKQEERPRHKMPTYMIIDQHSKFN